MRILFLIFLGINLSYASCPIKIDCTGFIQSTKEINIQILNTAYMSLDKTMDMMFELPSKKVKSFEVTLDYAQKQMDKANISRLQNA